MRIPHIVVVALLLSSAPFAGAQTVADASGHWEGAVQMPNNTELKFELDLEKDGAGHYAGTYGQPANGLKGFPLSTIAVDAGAVRFVLKAGDAPATFAGRLSADGKSIAGDVTQGDYTVPFSLTRTGDARIVAAPKNAAVGKELEGTWTGTIAADGREMRIVLKLANRPDGTAVGTVASPDGSGIEIPIAISQKATHVAIAVDTVGAAYEGVLNAAATEIAGTWTQGPVNAPLTFARAAR